ncbi:ParB/RepB/Spo0J family partition protein [Streptomyces sp. NPDC006872]|uniref:ParB/RepB/Spo0J family partition protein n=1 Tax=Streptomyces sp. NPDC006872 TaxID=3155720 RepID=UPI0033EBF51F
MSKADQLGAGRFGGTVRPVSARRQAVAAATGVPTEGIAPPTQLSPHRISLNPDNPRSKLGDLTDLAGSLTTHGQKQAITVMNRDAYVKVNPEREADLEADVTHVVIDGSSRLAAAREAGLTTVKVMVSDDEGTTAEELLESALVANIHRQDLEELDEARALHRLLAIHGSQRALAKRLHRSQGWVSQRLALLNLTPELQARIGKEPIDLLRAVGNKPADQQEAALEELKAERARKEEGTRSRKLQDSQAAAEPASAGVFRGAGDYDVITSAPDDGGRADEAPEDPAGDYDVITGEAESPAAGEDSGTPTTSEAIPEPRADSPAPAAKASAAREERASRKVPYDEPGSLAMLLDMNIPSDDVFFDLLQILSAKGLKRDPGRLHQLARSFAEQAAAQVD